MDDFRDALQQTLARNAQVETERREAEQERLRAEEERQQQEEEQRRREQELRNTRHADLVEHLQELLSGLSDTAGEHVVVRGGWTESGEEYVVKMSSVRMRPRRSLFLEIDRDDDEVLARWSSDVGHSVEMWRLGEVSTDMLTGLVLTLMDHQAWVDADRPPPFPVD